MIYQMHLILQNALISTAIRQDIVNDLYLTKKKKKNTFPTILVQTTASILWNSIEKAWTKNPLSNSEISIREP